jgi:phosphoribosyl 1,2-cyclic phosphodiesterase
LTTLHTFASGSEGNCALLSCGGTHLLLDAGISRRRIARSLAQLELSLSDVAGLLITHEHSDHICGVTTLTKYDRLPIYALPGTARQLACRIAGTEALLHSISQPFELGDFRVTPFSTSHDAAQSAGFRFDCADGSVGLLTDTGYVTDAAKQALTGVDLLVLESNHDVETLRSGPYPYPLKERILGQRGHLSNEAAADFAVQMALSGTSAFVLAHLSRENNTPVMALNTVERKLSAAGFAPRLCVAPRGEVSEAYQLERCVCRK